MIHTTIGLYANGEFKINGVKPEHLEDHIEYNKTMRFGRALFVDGKCVHKGYHNENNIKSFEDMIKDNPDYIRNVCTAPYV